MTPNKLRSFCQQLIKDLGLHSGTPADASSTSRALLSPSVQGFKAPTSLSAGAIPGFKQQLSDWTLVCDSEAEATEAFHALTKHFPFSCQSKTYSIGCLEPEARPQAGKVSYGSLEIEEPNASFEADRFPVNALMLRHPHEDNRYLVLFSHEGLALDKDKLDTKFAKFLEHVKNDYASDLAKQCRTGRKTPVGHKWHSPLLLTGDIDPCMRDAHQFINKSFEQSQRLSDTALAACKLLALNPKAPGSAVFARSILEKRSTISEEHMALLEAHVSENFRDLSQARSAAPELG
ncbi:hypothetical protein [Ferrimonas marina]|uniref:Uncharacterized protein n=1 Tax=Ferrimonas marina TaxID=299255 RepID=A0A1M5ULK8_9GAMM|nr:hypothetical protein [Ferrimonas marina]SHH63851.1 hypothetical protein SAMN02745129_2627 [Ferrimonas marina]